MATSKLLIAVFSLLVAVLIFQDVQAREMVGADGDMISSIGYSKRSLLQTIDCGAACSRRCSLSSRPNLCNRACGTCCARCNCVPPGTSGSQALCPCYYNQITHGGRRKCP